jgi:hypothetical protein
MESIPAYVTATFVIALIITVWLFSKATSYSKPVVIILITLIIIQSTLGLTGFYNNPQSMHVRLPLLVMPLVSVFTILFFTAKGRGFIDSLELKTLTILHTIRIPVELVLLWLYLGHTIPQALTFEGNNFDIISGLTAPLIYYFGVVKKQLGRGVIISWNVICIVLLLYVVSNAVLSLPTRYLDFGFEQPNIALGYFPFVLLPAILVPLVLFSNLAAIRQLLIKKG